MNDKHNGRGRLPGAYTDDVNGGMETLKIVERTTEQRAQLGPEAPKKDVLETPYAKMAKPKALKAVPLISGRQKFWTSVSEPPDMNYRSHIAEDQERMDYLQEDISIHFEKRCLIYQCFDYQM